MTSIPSEVEQCVEEVRAHFEKQLRELQEAYGEAMLELCARKKLTSLLGNQDDK